MEQTKNSNERVDHLNELEEFRFKAYEGSDLFKQNMNKGHDAKTLNNDL